MSSARSLWNGNWVIHDHSNATDPAFVPAPADVGALPPAARPLVLALVGAASTSTSSARIALADDDGNDAQLWVELDGSGTAEVMITGSVAEPSPSAALPPDLGITDAQLLGLTHHGLWVVDPAGRSLHVNDRMSAMLGIPARELAKRSPLAVVDPADRARMISLFDGTGEPARRPPAELHDIRFVAGDGGTVWTTVSVTRIADRRDHTTAVVAVVTDTTAYRRNEVVRLPAPLPEPEPALEAEPPSEEPVELVDPPAVPSPPPTVPPTTTALPPTAAETTADIDPYRAAFTHAPVGMAIIELDGTVREANRAMAALLDPNGTSAEPVRLSELVDNGERDELIDQLAALRAGTTARLRVEVPLNRTAEGTVWTLLSAAPVNGPDGRPAYAIAQAEDITERRVAEHDLVHQTLHDPLTGLGNRLLLRDQLQQALSIAGDVPFAVMFLDLDRFKSVNDTYGHDAGDALLVGVAQRLRRIVRSGDTVARLGGDEFAIIAQGIGDREGARILAEKVRAGLRSSFRVGDVDIAATASIGVVIGNREYATGDQLLRDADIAMYRAKDGGRDRHELFDDEIRLQEIERLETERTLHAALEGNGLKLHYQPVIDLHTGRAVGAEALLRIAGHDQTLLTPEAFLAVAEDSRLILDVGAWVVREVCAQLARWTDAGFGHLAAWINVTGLELASPRFASLVQRSLTAQRIDPSRLHVECTENVLLEAAPSTIEHLRSLAESGVVVGIDDFGTGYSSLGYLRDLPVSFLKIDAAFTRRLDEPGGASMVEAIIGLGRSLGLKIVAEGVESSSQMEALGMLGCDLAQGHLFAHPGPVEGLQLSGSADPDISWP